MYNDIIQIGNKIDIISMEAKEREKRGGEKAPVLRSQVDDVRDNGTIVIEMPMYQSRIVLVNVGNKYELMFYSKKGLYRAVCQVIERFKEGNLLFATVFPITDVVKFQRREYFRLQCMIDMKALVINKEKALSMSDTDIMAFAAAPVVAENMKPGTMLDISGGGCRFTSKTQYKAGDLVLIDVILENETDRLPFLFLMDVLHCNQVQNSLDTYETRGEFQKLNPKLRERIIKYIFDEDRKTRKRDSGI